MDPTHPRLFDAEYVQPAVEWWRRYDLEAHLAIHAITQFDNLAEVTALWHLLNGRSQLGHGEASGFRNEQGTREPALAVIRDIHDSHKHGRLRRTGNVFVSQGQRPARVDDYYKRDDVITEHGGPVAEVESVNVTLDDGTMVRVRYLLRDARGAWEREYARFGIAPL